MSPILSARAITKHHTVNDFQDLETIAWKAVKKSFVGIRKKFAKDDCTKSDSHTASCKKSPNAKQMNKI